MIMGKRMRPIYKNIMNKIIMLKYKNYNKFLKKTILRFPFKTIKRSKKLLIQNYKMAII